MLFVGPYLLMLAHNPYSSDFATSVGHIMSHLSAWETRGTVFSWFSLKRKQNKNIQFDKHGKLEWQHPLLLISGKKAWRRLPAQLLEGKTIHHRACVSLSCQGSGSQSELGKLRRVSKRKRKLRAKPQLKLIPSFQAWKASQGSTEQRSEQGNLERRKGLQSIYWKCRQFPELQMCLYV